ncbi:MAG: hypothetical protein JSS99_14330 [Actinobacteria bacterium]|nr:hypothetical protein [Actinomycetota bacterium]
MSQVSRPMQIALAATLLLVVVWFVALRPKSSSGGEQAAAPAPTAPLSDGGAAPGTAGLKSAIDQAHGAVATADGDAQRAQQSSADGPAPADRPAASAPGAPAASAPAHGGSAAASKPHAARRGAHARHRHAGAARSQVQAVRDALRHHKAVAVAFVDLNTADGLGVAQEIRHVSTLHGHALAVAVSLDQLSRFAFITNRVEVTVAPTVVIVDPRRRATTIVGAADRVEIEQRLADALAATPSR